MNFLTLRFLQTRGESSFIQKMKTLTSLDPSQVLWHSQKKRVANNHFIAFEEMTLDFNFWGARFSKNLIK